MVPTLGEVNQQVYWIVLSMVMPLSCGAVLLIERGLRATVIVQALTRIFAFHYFRRLAEEVH